jgi:mannose-6-phosphate isomerase-like protein (cupin superfamily)
MISPSGCREPGQTPEFDEYTVVLKGELQVETGIAVHKVLAGQAIVIPLRPVATLQHAGRSPGRAHPRIRQGDELTIQIP